MIFELENLPIYVLATATIDETDAEQKPADWDLMFGDLAIDLDSQMWHHTIANEIPKRGSRIDSLLTSERAEKLCKLWALMLILDYKVVKPRPTVDAQHLLDMTSAYLW